MKKRNEECPVGKEYKPNGRYNKKGNHTFSKSEDVGYKIGDNDISWWKMSDQLLNDVCRLPFGRAAGLDYPSAYWGRSQIDQTGTRSFIETKSSVPGIAVLTYLNACGSSFDGSSSLNVAARAIYSYVRHANSGHTNYESGDLMVYLLAVGEIYSAIAYLEKVYGSAQYWSQRNRYFGDRLITALGFSATDVRNNLAPFRTGINLLVAKVNALSAPKAFSLYQRRFFLASHIYKDEDVPTCQLYTFLPGSLLCYAPGLFSTGSALCSVVTPWAQSNASVANALDFVNAMIDSLLSDEDIGIMGGDILKAFGNGEKGGLHTLLPVPDGFITEPVYSEEMMQQIHNCTFGASTGYTYMPQGPHADGTDVRKLFVDNSQVTPTFTTLGTTYLNSIAQVNGQLLSRHGIGMYYSQFQVLINGANTAEQLHTPRVAGFWLDMFKPEPDPSDVMIATRLKFQLYKDGTEFTANSTVNRDIIVGTECVLNIRIYDLNKFIALDNQIIIVPSQTQSTYGSPAQIVSGSLNTGDARNSILAAIESLKFHRFPHLFKLTIESVIGATGPTDSFRLAHFNHFNDVEVFFSEGYDSNILATMHDSALLSVFRVPDLGIYKV